MCMFGIGARLFVICNLGGHSRKAVSLPQYSEHSSPNQPPMNTPTGRTVAVVGASTDRRKFGNKGVRAFQAAGWRVIPVNPNERIVEGLATAASVTDIAGPVDVVSLYVPPAVGLKLLPAIAAKTPGELWLNPGTVTREFLAEAARLGLKTRQLCSIIEIGYTPTDFS